MGRSRMVESIPWSVLFLLMSVGVLMIWMDRKKQRELYLVSFVSTAFILLNQQVIHGVRFLFASHYLMFLVFAGVTTCVFMAHHFLWDRKISAPQKMVRILAFGSSLIFLSGIAYDNRSLIGQWRIDAGDFEEQHLAGTLPILDALPHATILSDPSTSAFISGYTQHNVLYTYYIQHELHTHREIAERYCLTQRALSPKKRHPENEPVLVYGAAYDAIFDPGERAKVREQELQLVSDVCTEVDFHTPDFLMRYGVQYVLWDKKRQPEWSIERFNVHLKEVQRGDGWELWKI